MAVAILWIISTCVCDKVLSPLSSSPVFPFGLNFAGTKLFSRGGGTLEAPSSLVIGGTGGGGVDSFFSFSSSEGEELRCLLLCLSPSEDESLSPWR